jgi:hypothetical protein
MIQKILEPNNTSYAEKNQERCNTCNAITSKFYRYTLPGRTVINIQKLFEQTKSKPIVTRASRYVNF